MSATSIFVLLILSCVCIIGVSSIGHYGHAVIRSTTLGPNLDGVITFSQSQNPFDQVTIQLSISGLPIGKYGIHIHLYGDAYDVNATGAGTHFNPYNAPHGCWPDKNRHAGDIGNFSITSVKDVTSVTFVRDLMDLSLEGSVIGRSVIIHAVADNCQQPTGNAGAWIGQGVIGIANPSYFSDSDNLALSQLGVNPTSAIAVFHPLADAGSGSKLSGWIQFNPLSDGRVRVTSAIYNVPASTLPGAENVHGIHVHGFGHDEPTGSLAGDHFNVDNWYHAPLSDHYRHTGDLGNYTLTFDPETQLYSGFLDVTTPDTVLSFTAANGNIIGRSVILHADRDDGNPSRDPYASGNAGKRIAIAIIGISGRQIIVPTMQDRFAERFHF